MCFFAVPAADDFFYAFEARDRGYIDANVFWFQQVNARWAATAVLTLHPLLWKDFASLGYQAFPMVLLLGLFLGFKAMLSSPLAPGLSKSAQWGIPLIGTLLYLHQLPIISEGLYWLPGSVTYLIPCILLLFYASQLGFWLQRPTSLRLVVLVGFILLLTGFSEIAVLVICALNACLALYFIHKKRAHKGTLVFLSLLPLLGLILLLNSSGNLERAEKYPEGGQLLFSLGMSALQVFRFSAKWSFNLPLIAATLVLLPQLKNWSLPNAISPWKWTIILLLPIFLAVFPPYWATGILGQHRTLTIALLAFLPLWFIHAQAWYNWYTTNPQRGNFKWITHWSRPLLFVGFLGLLVSGNGLQCLYDLGSGQARLYEQEMKSRYTTLLQVHQAGTHRAELKPLSSHATSLMVVDLKADPNHWINEGWARYFRVDTVALTEQPQTEPEIKIDK